MNALAHIQILFHSSVVRPKSVKRGAMTLLELQKIMFVKSMQLLELWKIFHKQ